MSDIERLDRKLKRYGKDIGSKAAPTAINKAGKSTQAKARQLIAAITGLPANRVNKDIYRKPARRGALSSYIDATAGRATNLARFVTPARRRLSGGAGQPQFFRKRTKKGFKYPGVIANPWKRKQEFKGAFIARGQGTGGVAGNAVVFVRTGRGRDSKLKALRGPSIRQEFNRPPLRAAMRQRLRERLSVEMDRAVRGILRRTQ